jgi:hypothetical protein
MLYGTAKQLSLCIKFKKHFCNAKFVGITEFLFIMFEFIIVSLTFTMYKHKFVFEVSTKPFFGVSFLYVRSHVIVGISCFHIVLASCLGGCPQAHIIGG